MPSRKVALMRFPKHGFLFSLCVVIGYTSRVEGQYKSPGVGLLCRCRRVAVAVHGVGSGNPQVVGSSPTGRTEQSPSHPVTGRMRRAFSLPSHPSRVKEAFM